MKISESLVRIFGRRLLHLVWVVQMKVKCTIFSKLSLGLWEGRRGTISCISALLDDQETDVSRGLEIRQAVSFA